MEHYQPWQAAETLRRGCKRWIKLNATSPSLLAHLPVAEEVNPGKNVWRLTGHQGLWAVHRTGFEAVTHVRLPRKFRPQPTVVKFIRLSEDEAFARITA